MRADMPEETSSFSICVSIEDADWMGSLSSQLSRNKQINNDCELFQDEAARFHTWYLSGPAALL